jgi:hypothetical protein
MEPLVVPTGVVKLDCPGLTDDMALSLGADSWYLHPRAVRITAARTSTLSSRTPSTTACNTCAAHKHFSDKDECTVLTFRVSQTLTIPKDYGNCWLKKGTPQASRPSDDNINLTCGVLLKGSAVQSSNGN